VSYVVYWTPTGLSVTRLFHIRCLLSTYRVWKRKSLTKYHGYQLGGNIWACWWPLVTRYFDSISWFFRVLVVFANYYFLALIVQDLQPTYDNGGTYIKKAENMPCMFNFYSCWRECGSKAFFRVSLYVHDRTKMAETTITKLAIRIVHHESWLILGQRSTSHGHRV